MKRIILLMLLCVLTACGSNRQSEPVGSEKPLIAEGIEFYTQNNDGELNDWQTGKLNEYITGTSTDGFIHTKRLAELEKAGITVGLEKVYKVDSHNIILTLSITNNFKKSMALEFPVQACYDTEPTLQCFYVRGGNISVNGDELIVAYSDSVEFYNLQTFEKLDKSLDLTYINSYDSIILDVIGSVDGKYVMVYNRSGDEKLTVSVFNSDGSFGQTVATSIGSRRACLFPYDTEGRFFRCAEIVYYGAMFNGVIIDAFEKEEIDIGYSKTYTQGDYSLEITASNYNHMALVDYIAIRRYQGDIIDVFTFKQDKWPQLDSIDNTGPGYVDGTEPEYNFRSFNRDMSVAVFATTFECIRSTIDFNNRTATFVKYGTPEDQWHKRLGDYEVFVDFSDHFRPFGKWVYVYNHATGVQKELGYFDHNSYYEYYDNIDVGFTPEGDIYVCRNDMYKTYDKDTFRVKFDITNVFKLEYNPVTNTRRGLVDIRRDPVDGTFLILYSELEHTDPNATNNFKSIKYNLAYTDRWGNVIRQYPLPDGYLATDTTITLVDPITVEFHHFNSYMGRYHTSRMDLQTGRYTVIEDHWPDFQ